MGPADDWRAQPPLPGWVPIPWGSNFDDDAEAAVDDAAGDDEDAVVVAAARDRAPRPRTRSNNEGCRSIPDYHSIHRPS